MNCFSHLWDFEPTQTNHWVPPFGLFSNAYFYYGVKSMSGIAEKYSSFAKDHGPPYGRLNPNYYPLEVNEYLINKGVNIEALKAIHAKAEPV